MSGQKLPKLCRAYRDGGDLAGIIHWKIRRDDYRED